jgi:glycosyltransferase involved in cell wall biosynthesis
VRTPIGSSPPPPPSLSVITPAYNVEPYLPRCIESVLAQTWQDLELVIIDDGSTDGTADVISDYAARDSRVRGFRGRNRGVSYARNVAMKHARGRYFGFIDGDDEWEPTFAATLIAVLAREPRVAVVTGNALNAGGGALDGRPVRPWPADACNLSFLDMIEHEDAVFIMSIFRREVYDTIGGFNEALHRSEDYEFWLRAAAAGFAFRTHPEPLARYRRRADSATADQAGMFEGIMTVLRSARGFRHRARAEELGAIDRQLDKLQSDYVLTKGKAALMRGDVVEARSHFWELHRRGKGLPFAALSLGLLVAPNLVRYAYRARLEKLERQAARDQPAVAPVHTSSEERERPPSRQAS